MVSKHIVAVSGRLQCTVAYLDTVVIVARIISTITVHIPPHLIERELQYLSSASSLERPCHGRFFIDRLKITRRLLRDIKYRTQVWASSRLTIIMDEDKKIATSEHARVDRLESNAEGIIVHMDGGGTKRNIKSRHAQMIAIGGTIGTGLFVGSGQALAIGGPGFLLPAYCIITLLVYAVITAVIEVCAYLPISGSSMAYYCSRFVSPSLGFALGWLYFYSFGIIAAYEITAASIVINYWPNGVPEAVWITIM